VVSGLYFWLCPFFILLAGFRSLKKSLQKAFRAVYPALHNTFDATGVFVLVIAALVVFCAAGGR
jgi:hypothetical protein